MSYPGKSTFSGYVLVNGKKSEILEKLQQEKNLRLECQNDKKMLTTILENDKLTEEEIIEIFKFMQNQGVNLFDWDSCRSAYASWQLAIHKRMRNLTEFFINSRNPKSRNILFLHYFINDESEKLRDAKNTDDLNTVEREGIQFFEWLISKKRRFNAKNIDGETALDLSVSSNLQHILLVLLRYVDIPNFDAMRTELLLHRFLYRNSPNFPNHNHNRRHTLEVLKILLNMGVTVNSQTITGVEFAIEKRLDMDIIKILIDYFPIDCDKKSFATKLLIQLIKYPLATLTELKTNCYLQILHSLVSKGADVNTKDEFEMVAVQVALKECNIHAIRWLDEVGADFNVLTKDKKNLLHLLVAEKGDEIVQQEIFNVFIRKGCEVNGKDIDHATPLHLAIKHNNELFARKLIGHDANVNCQDINMWTPMHYAFAHMPTPPLHFDFYNNTLVKPRTELIEMLLKTGANVNSKSNKGERPLFLMLSNAHCDASVLEMLLGWGVQVDTLNEINDMETLKLVVYNTNATVVEEFFKYGLDINGSNFCHFLHDKASNNRFVIRGLLHLHCIKLKTAKLACSEEYNSPLLPSKQRWSDNCLREVNLLKTTSIDSRTSLYDFLCMDLDCKCIYVNNDTLKNLVDSPKLEEQFPMYSVLILANYRKAMTRKLLLGPAKAAWLELTEIYLPDICIERILFYLRNVDLVDMIGEVTLKINGE